MEKSKKSEENKKKKKQVILKRQVAVSSVVTERYKQYLLKEVERSEKTFIEKAENLKNYADRVGPDNPRYYEYTLEREKVISSLESLPAQRKEFENLQIGSLHSQGVLDGFVTLSVGDDLYEKLSGVEIIVTDGKITNITSQPNGFFASQTNFG